MISFLSSVPPISWACWCRLLWIMSWSNTFYGTQRRSNLTWNSNSCSKPQWNQLTPALLVTGGRRTGWRGGSRKGVLSSSSTSRTVTWHSGLRICREYTLWSCSVLSQIASGCPARSKDLPLWAQRKRPHTIFISPSTKYIEKIGAIGPQTDAAVSRLINWRMSWADGFLVTVCSASELFLGLVSWNSSIITAQKDENKGTKMLRYIGMAFVIVVERNVYDRDLNGPSLLSPMMPPDLVRIIAVKFARPDKKPSGCRLPTTVNKSMLSMTRTKTWLELITKFLCFVWLLKNARSIIFRRSVRSAEL